MRRAALDKARAYRTPEERLGLVEELLCEQLSRRAIERQLSELWGVTGRTIRNYVRKVFDRWAQERREESPEEREARFEQVERSFARVYRRAYSKGDHIAAVQALDRICRLRGLYPDGKVLVEGRFAHLHAHGQAAAPGSLAALGAAELAALDDSDLEALERVAAKLAGRGGQLLSPARGGDDG